MSDTLDNLLERASMFSAEYGNRLTSHLTMTLISLQKLGADNSDLDRFYSLYSPRLARKPKPRFKISTSDWRRYLGTREHHGDMASFFLSEIARSGREATLRNYLPTLAQGVASCGFHGLIRTAYGIEAGHDGEIAEGMALWANGYVVLAASASPTENRDAMDILDELRRRKPYHSDDLAGIPIAEAMIEIDSEKEFGDLAAGIRMRDDLLSHLASLAAIIFYNKPDFAALHLITATHALRIILPYSVHDEMLNAFWIGFAAIYIQIGTPEFNFTDPVLPIIPEWRAIIAVALERLDDHLVKLIYSCREEEKMYGSKIYSLIASRQTGIFLPYLSP